jgi:hypothetical protein
VWLFFEVFDVGCLDVVDVVGKATSAGNVCDAAT